MCLVALRTTLFRTIYSGEYTLSNLKVANFAMSYLNPSYLIQYTISKVLTGVLHLFLARFPTHQELFDCHIVIFKWFFCQAFLPGIEFPFTFHDSPPLTFQFFFIFYCHLIDILLNYKTIVFSQCINFDFSNARKRIRSDKSKFA